MFLLLFLKPVLSSFYTSYQVGWYALSSSVTLVLKALTFPGCLGKVNYLFLMSSIIVHFFKLCSPSFCRTTFKRVSRMNTNAMTTDVRSIRIGGTHSKCVYPSTLHRKMVIPYMKADSDTINKNYR